MFLFIINIILCGLAAIGVMRNTLSSQRGTNAVTRTIRDSASNFSNSMVLSLCGVLLVIDLIFLMLGGSIWTKISFILPGLLLAVVFLLMRKSNKSEQRKKDARVVTKGGLQVTAATAETVGTVAGAAHGNPAAGKMIGKAVGSVADSAAQNMEEPGLDTEELATVAANPETVEALMKRANRAGIETEGRTPEEVAEDVLKYSSEQQVAQLPEDMSTVDKAVKLLGQEE